jgi:hypothetical protein
LPRHRLPVAAHGLPRRQTRVRAAESARSSSHGRARGQSLHVPFPGTPDRFVEVVQIEHERPLGRRVQAEVQEVGIAAGLHVDPGRRRPGQIGGHDGRRAAEVCERRVGHAGPAQRHEPGDAAPALLFEDPERVPALVRRPLGVRVAGRSGADRAAQGSSFRPRDRRRLPGGLRGRGRHARANVPAGSRRLQGEAHKPRDAADGHVRRMNRRPSSPNGKTKNRAMAQYSPTATAGRTRPTRIASP